MQTSSDENSSTLGHVVVIRRDGKDGGKFPVNRDIMIGRHEQCHIRISLSTVSRRHSLLRIDSNERKVYLRNMSMTNPTHLNDKSVTGLDACLQHLDVLKIGDRQFRWEYTADILEKFKETKIATETAVNQDVSASTKEFKRVLTTPIRNDIKKRRLSTPALRVPVQEPDSCSEEEHESLSAENEASFDFENIDVDEIQPKDESSVQKRSLPTPIREEINIQSTPTPAKGYEDTIEFSTNKKSKEPRSWTPACEGMGRLFLTPQADSNVNKGSPSELLHEATVTEPSPAKEQPEEQHVDQENSSTDAACIEEKFEHESDFNFSVEFNMSCKKNDVIEALDYEESEKCYMFFNAIVVGKPTKSRGVPIKFLDEGGKPIGRKRSVKYCRALVAENDSEKEVVTEAEPENEKIDFSSLRVVDLRAELKKRGLLTRGRKAELIQRLNEATK